MAGVSPGMIPGLDSSSNNPDVPNNQLHEFSAQCSQESGEERKKDKVHKKCRIFKEPSVKASCLVHSNDRWLQARDSCIHRKRFTELEKENKLTEQVVNDLNNDVSASTPMTDVSASTDVSEMLEKCASQSYSDHLIDKLTRSIVQEKEIEAATVASSHRDRSFINATGRPEWVDGMVEDGTSSEGSENGDNEYDETVTVNAITSNENEDGPMLEDGMLKNTKHDGDEHVKASNNMEDAAYGGAVSAA